MTAHSIRIAIIGGGLAGASVANALTRLARLEIHVFESAPEFSERGAAIGLSGNAQHALQEFIPHSKQLLEAAGAVPMQSSRVMIASGTQAGAFVCDVGDALPRAVVVHRASLLRELLAPLPQRALHANKAVASVQSLPEGGVLVAFTDGHTERFDAVIGADGVFSVVREHVVPGGESASPSGFWDCRNLISYERAKSLLGGDLFDLDRQYGWVGDGAYFMHDVLENRTLVHCVMSAIETVSPPDRTHQLNKPFLQGALRTWANTPIAEKMMDIILDQPNPQAYSAWEHKKTSTYTEAQICLVGDAAHATTPWQGAGAGLAMEDAMVMGALLAEVSSPADIQAAFRAFDIVRRERCQRVIDSSRGTGQILCGNDPQVKIDVTEIRNALKDRWEFIHSLDMKKHQEDALGKMRELRDGS